VTTTAQADSPLRTAMALLASGVPLSLLLDLAYGPSSEDLLLAERVDEVPGPRGPRPVSLPG